LRHMTVESIARWSTVIMAAGFFLAAISSQEWAHWASLVPITIGIALGIVSLITMFSNAVGPEAQGWVMGVSTAVMAMAWLLTGFASGLLTYLSLVFPFILCGILACVSLWSMLRE
jgi:MFS transporter, DHA1 family, tetracycline resistance protein